MADTAQTNGTHSAGAAAGPSKRRQVPPKEDARKNQFGVFTEAEALTLTDVQFLLTSARTRAGAPTVPDNKVYKSAVDHVNEFANASAEVMDSMRTALASHNATFLSSFESTQIMYLRPENREVALALIPSLARLVENNKEDQHAAELEKLDQVLDDMRNIVRYGARP